MATSIPVTRTYLEMTGRGALRSAPLPPYARVEREVPSSAAGLARRLYLEVGRDHHWRDRADWSADQWESRFAAPGVSLWVLRVDGEPAGYAELNTDAAGDVEIVYFGLLRPFQGRGLGKGLLSAVVDRAWAIPAARVWLHTCTLDAPSALPNYLARGFRAYRTEEYVVPADPPR